MAQTLRNRVFISYSHRDRRYLERLHVHLAPYERDGLIDYWDDTKLEAGADWNEAIKEAISSAQIAILLVSADFLASRFIANDELPPLLEAAKGAGVKIFSIVLAPCSFDRTPLARYQAIHDVSRPLSALTYHQKEEIWKLMSEEVAQTLQSETTPKALALPMSKHTKLPKNPFDYSPAQATQLARQLNDAKEFAQALQTIQRIALSDQKDYGALFEYVSASARLPGDKNKEAAYDAFVQLYYLAHWRSAPFGQNAPKFPADASFAVIAGAGSGAYSFAYIDQPQVCYFIDENGLGIVKGMSLASSSVYVDCADEHMRWVGMIASWA